MTDLFILTADPDAQAVIQSVLTRSRELRIQPVSFRVHRFPGRDPGMVKEGPEIARTMVRKSEFSKLILVWDHEGSGWHTKAPGQAEELIQQRLDGVTWKANSAAIVAVPEIEEWLWHCPASIARYLGVEDVEVETIKRQVAKKAKVDPGDCVTRFPKELFERLFYHKKKKMPLPGDFERLGALANLSRWSGSKSFAKFTQTLRDWFPLR